MGDQSVLTIAPEKNSTSVEVLSLSVAGSATVSASSGASVSVCELVMSGEPGETTIEASGYVSFAAGLKINIPNKWSKARGRYVIANVRAGGEFSADARILTDDGKDVTDKAQLTVTSGTASVCFDRGFVVYLK
jgi:hypothetical protein